MKYFESSNYEDCRINASPSFTNYQGINRVAPSFVMIDLDLRDFGNVQINIDKGLDKILRKIRWTSYCIVDRKWLPYLPTYKWICSRGGRKICKIEGARWKRSDIKIHTIRRRLSN